MAPKTETHDLAFDICDGKYYVELTVNFGDVDDWKLKVLELNQDGPNTPLPLDPIPDEVMTAIEKELQDWEPDVEEEREPTDYDDMGD